MSYFKDDIIVAQATPTGQSALAIIRISGTSLSSLYKKLTNNKKINPRYAINSKIFHPQTGQILDDSLIIFYSAPSSFTGQDLIEINCHGGLVIAENIINAVLDFGGRSALPGEFSFRAYINGKLDLVQAEAISALIGAKTSLSADVSLNALSGSFKKNVEQIKSKLMNLLVILENELDFSESEIDFTTHKEINDLLLVIKTTLKSILSTSLFGRALKYGIKVVLIGKPNAGKSSLFNAMLGQNRALVSEVKGTTRDYIESWIDIDGIPVRLFDTAGIHKTSDPLESLSIKKTKGSLLDANIFILVDEHDPLTIRNLLDINKDQRLLFVCSKSDLKDKIRDNSKIIHTSIKKNKGINNLLTKLSTQIKSLSFFSDRTDAVIITRRQRRVIKRSLSSLDECILLAKKGASTDLISSMLRTFLSQLDTLHIDIHEEDVLKNIFQSFCIGK